MARVYLTSSAQHPIISTVEAPVGTGLSNRRDDVLLVQFFLKVISSQDSGYKPEGAGTLSVSGVFDTTTAKYIKKYQEENSRRNPDSPLSKDGRVDPVVGGKFSGSISKAIYTIVAMNVSYRIARNIATLGDITNDPEFPKDLRPSLKIA